MQTPIHRYLQDAELLRSMRLANANAALWAVGNGLVSTLLVIYLANDLNVGLDNIKLKLAPTDNNAPFVAIYHATGDLANGIATIIGGAIYDYLATAKTPMASFYTQIFLLGFVARLLAVPLLARLIEPGAKRLRDLTQPAL